MLSVLAINRLSHTQTGYPHALLGHLLSHVFYHVSACTVIPRVASLPDSSLVLAQLDILLSLMGRLNFILSNLEILSTVALQA